MNTSQKNFMVPLAFVGMMFFAIGFALGINSFLMPVLERSMEMSASESNLLLAASLLQIPMMEIRFAADSIGPRIVTYGFTDAWSTALAAPQMNEAKRNHTIDSVAAAWMNNPKAIAKMMNERAIVFL